jgi:hypothetical protein
MTFQFTHHFELPLLSLMAQRSVANKEGKNSTAIVRQTLRT